MPWEVQEMHKESTQIWEGWIFEAVPVWNSCAYYGAGYGLGHHVQPVQQFKARTMTHESQNEILSKIQSTGSELI